MRKKIQKNGLTIALNILYVKKINPSYVSKHNSDCEKQVNLKKKVNICIILQQNVPTLLR